jgi:hypothetical protein
MITARFVVATFAKVALACWGSIIVSAFSQTDGRDAMTVPLRVAAWTERLSYSLDDELKLDVTLQNFGAGTIYVDRRMFWTGLAGGLQLRIEDEGGGIVPAPLLSDAIMPPPDPTDMEILVRLDGGYSYGTWARFRVGDVIKKTGRYSIAVVYKSWLQREWVAQQLRNKPALWSDAQPISSNKIWIDVTR